AAATFGLGVQQLRPNIARDDARLREEVDRLGSRLVGAVLLESADDGSLAWVADQLRAQVDEAGPGERSGPTTAADLRLLVRLVLADAPAPRARAMLTLPTCERCQPAVATLIADNKLAVATIAAQAEICICERTSGGNLSLRIRFAARLVEESGIL